ncbi:alanine--tRNA ligase [Flavobacterium covae]|uniref:Alanine--tRNA ligase n=1 Tax=Flavobacterium columnare TaxID=996 RepID=A0AA94F421_9FLAO|nr:MULTISPECIES: alanine--tRNA ligase [Flavobacterium]OXA82917.1 alanine--tRNA ligase [Flavobacterium columnare] [Flavobacterium columnare NBRC 100251 = ATCC 23463]AND63395.1 alanine--tRNA ligase [Flavobacterium covae]MCH4828420.1 alanine--tRNA ligase [Flavobacterium columnare]MCH4832248.1 alanine--tRNA ligase [Flavobacterium columnare]MCJ1805848.1 alanine--tRNA ligase [Flavobacterium covae]
MKSQDIRKAYLDFFKSKNHLIVPSAPIVLKDDPTLMFNNSGMAQFKEFFLGNGTPKSPRIADTQKCLRVSGKHNDLEDVGFDTYHHTMFEMLGNWSFGDYFKKEALAWAWEFLTEVLKLDKDRLYVSVFEGNPSENVPFDQEAFDIWKQYVTEDRIILGNKKDNFWEMGDQGPCGPCSEIHIDLRSDEERAKVSGKSLVNDDHPQVVEIWNNVFMEFNRKADGSLEKLPAQHVDTGMGFERLCMAMQGVTSNYDTDVFTPLIEKVTQITHLKYTNNEIKNITEEQDKINIAIRVIVDHVRAVAFAIADGQLPSNTGAGYVIRRILRRAIRYGFTFLNKKEPFINELVVVLANQMGSFFPEIKAQQNLVTQVIREEEASFLRTLEQGLQLLEKVVAETIGNEVKGEKVFELYDTFGFPKDLTALILKEKGYSYNEAEFDTELDKQKARSRAASEVSTEDWKVLIDGNVETFVGYDQTENEVKITRIRKVDSKKDGILYQIVLDNTPFYPEGGGQVGDKGTLVSANETIEIIDTKKENNLILHFAKHLPENISATFQAKVNTELRSLCASNHSATHLLHQALRSILGTHVEQKGSLVAPNYLRFDFSHFSKVTEEELRQVEDFVNARIQEQLPLIERRSIPFAQAIEEGAMALFGEKYGDNVRAIKFGDSMELCGGIHVSNTAEIWHFKIISEGAVAAGIRRIEAITNNAVKDFFAKQENLITEVKEVLKNPQDIIKSVVSLQDENVKLKKQIEQLLKEKAKNLKGELVSQLQHINGVDFLAVQVDLDANGAKDLAYELGQNKDNLFVVLATINEEKPMLTCYISKELVETKGLNAGSVVRELGKYIQGGGGGQAFFATAGGKNPTGVQEALEKATDFLK